MNSLSKDVPIYVAGHRGMVGSALVRRLETLGYTNLITATRQQVNLLDQEAVRAFLAKTNPAFIFIAAAKVGGILANSAYPADFLYQNLVLAGNLIEGAHRAGIERLMFLGSSCIYPRDCPQPIREDYLLTGPLEETNAPYAIAKIAGLKLCEAFNRQHGAGYFSVMPANLYGPNDNYDLETSHVLPALIRKTHEAKERGDEFVMVWGSGRPLREFLHVDDLADACVTLMERGIRSGVYNIGSGTDISIEELARLVMAAVEFHGKVVFDRSKPDGTPRKLLDISKISDIGWSPKYSLAEGVRQAYEAYLLSRRELPVTA